MSTENYTSLQGVLDSIIRNYLLNELPPELGESNTRPTIAERDFGLSQLGDALQNLNLQTVRTTNNASDLNPNASNTAQGSVQQVNNGETIDQEYIKALHECFERRGIFRELQTFLRHKLVSILQEEWPNMHKAVGPANEPSPIIFRLVEDFLRCHRLFYSLSVLASESDLKLQNAEAQFGKLSARDAENLLDEMGIRRKSRLSDQIIKCYFDKDNFSLLETMHYLGIWMDLPLDNLQLQQVSSENLKVKGSCSSIYISHAQENALNKRQDKSVKLTSDKSTPNIIEQRLQEIQERMKRDQEIKLQHAITTFKNQEIKIRQELETKYKMELIAKEQEHNVNLQKHVEEINSAIQHERQEWQVLKTQQENELRNFQQQSLEMMTEMNKIKSQHQHEVKSIRSQVQTFGTDGVILPSVSIKGLRPQTFKDEGAYHLQHHYNCQKNFPSDTENNEKYHKSASSRFDVDTMQRDKIAFLQYRLEQQEEEIKSLQKQVILSPRNPIQATTITQAHFQHIENPQGAGRGNDKTEEVETFISKSKQRMNELDKCAAKVDHLFQQFTTHRKKVITPLQSEISARLESIRRKKLHKSSVLHSTSNLLSPMMHNYTVEHPQQQWPDQSTFINSVLKNLPSFNLETFQTSRPVMSFPVEDTPNIDMTNSRQSSHDIVLQQEVPSTPTNLLFPVAYGNSNDIPRVTRSKSNDSTNGKERSVAIKDPEDVPNNPIDASINTAFALHAEPEQVIESLFHKAMREKESSPTSSSSINLKEKAMRNGALLREKLSSDSESSDTKNKSISEGLKVLRRKTGALNTSKIQSESAIEKSKVTVDAFKNGSVEERKSSVESIKNGRKTPLAKSKYHLKSNDLSSVSTSTSSKVSSHPQNLSLNQQSPKHSIVNDPENTENDENSLLISVAKSENGNNDDFWQL